MIGSRYWSSGIIVTYRVNPEGTGGWHVTVNFYDDGWANDDRPQEGIVATGGKLYTAYVVKDADSLTCLTAAVDTVVRDARGIGVLFEPTAGVGPFIYYGMATEFPPPDGWQVMLDNQAERLGWPPLYQPYGTPF